MSLDAPGIMELARSRSSFVSTRNVPPRNSLLSPCTSQISLPRDAYSFSDVDERIGAAAGKVEGLAVVLGVDNVHAEVLEELFGLGQVGMLVSHMRQLHDSNGWRVGHVGYVVMERCVDVKSVD